MKKNFIIFILLNSIIVHGQVEFKGTVKTYEDSLEIPFAMIIIDTIDLFKGFSVHQPIDSSNTNWNGEFSIKTEYSGKLNMIITFMGFVPLTIKNIEGEKNKKVIDIGDIYLPNRGQWIEGYKPPEGESKKEARQRRKKWKKDKEPVPINWAGFSPDFFEPYKGMDTIYLEYPLNGIERRFQIKNESLIINYEEFIKE